MGLEDKKNVLRMIPYGLYVLMTENNEGKVAAATVNWVTQTSFDPPLLAVAIKKDSLTYTLVREKGLFSLNMLGKKQQAQAFTFFKALERDGNRIGGEAFENHEQGVPLLSACPAFVVLRTVEVVEQGDHHIFVAEVIDAGLRAEFDGRADAYILRMEDLGEKVFYGG